MSQPYLVTGAKGMLGTSLLERLAARGIPAEATDLPETDLTDPDAAEALLARVRPAWVLHCAAYTDVDGAESDPDACTRANAEAPAHLARSCARHGAALLLLSTDYVFDGEKGTPYLETDPTGPLSHYGRTKLEGEKAVASLHADHAIVRSAWLYGPGRRNFVQAILGRLAAGQPLRVVADQTGTPTYTPDLADALIDLARRNGRGTFHLVNGGACTWHAFACEIAALSGYDPARIEPIPASDWPSPARRPRFSILDCSKAHALGVPALRHWREAIAAYLQKEPSCPKN